MSFANMQVTDMIPVSRPWTLDQKALFLSIEEIAALHPKIVSIQSRGEDVLKKLEASAQVAALTDLLRKTDSSHDSSVKVVHDGFQCAIGRYRTLEPPKEQEATILEGAYAKLLPDGLSISQRSYPTEAGVAARLDNVLDEETRAILTTVPVVEGTLLDAVLTWRAYGLKLGNLMKDRGVAEGNAKLTEDMSLVRRDWINIVEMVLRLLDFSDARPEKIEAIREPVLQAKKAAARRAAARAARSEKNAALETSPDSPPSEAPETP